MGHSGWSKFVLEKIKPSDKTEFSGKKHSLSQGCLIKGLSLSERKRNNVNTREFAHFCIQIITQLFWKNSLSN